MSFSRPKRNQYGSSDANFEARKILNKKDLGRSNLKICVKKDIRILNRAIFYLICTLAKPFKKTKGGKVYLKETYKDKGLSQETCWLFYGLSEIFVFIG